MKCSECGKATFGKATRFCAPRCKVLWHRRQKKRGAQLFNAFMASRYDRGGPVTLGYCNSLAAMWRAEDEAAGRVSYHDELVPPIVKVWR